ncbi:GNAT family N-acetyltransferase [Paenibacillus pinistramenti]|uniref:GNAT family N-acetyltransferase n=1 Tax=Paenibacillus pinistramenti TaxID=1768003 RepID=UPI0011098BFD|nr:GNAT family N-acetyltransferase [Paenibacillus pinistramenti]
MIISPVRPEELSSWESYHGTLLAFIRKYASKRITADAYRAVLRLTPQSLAQPGTGIMQAVVSTEDGLRLAGVLCTAGYGQELSAAVVHPLYRSRGIGTLLMKAQLEQLGQMNCRVAIDNLSSLKMCFKAGLSAGGLTTGPTGKPTLLFSGKPAPA